MIVALIVRLFAICGVTLAPVWAGVIIAGAIGAAFTTYSVKLYDAGYASADKRAEIAALQSELAAAKMDMFNALAASKEAQDRLDMIQSLSKADKERTDAYVRELESRPAVSAPATVCDDLLDQRDLDGMQPRSGARNPEPRPAGKARVYGPGRKAPVKAP